jgi:hypothetical protein
LTFLRGKLKMNFKPLYFLPVTIIALGVLGQTQAAEAVVFGIGDTLNITNGVDVQKTDSGQELLLFNDLSTPPIAQPVGSYGSFGVQDDSTGGFEAFRNAGTVIGDYQILSVDFEDPTSYLNRSFLQAVMPGLDEFIFEITTEVTGDIVEQSVLGTVVGFASTHSFGGLFKDGAGNVLAKGVGIVTAQGGVAQPEFDSYSASFFVTETESVPEPATVLALFSMVGALGLRRRKNQSVEA